jgi:hypothetical protein
MLKKNLGKKDMKKTIKRFMPNIILKNLRKIFLGLIFVYCYLKVKKVFKNNNRFTFFWRERYPQLYDNRPDTNFDRHYIYHPAWAIRIVKQINPKKHVDISSTLNFSSTLSAFIPVDFYDYRPADLELSNLNSKSGNLLNLPFADNSIESISCMHTIEHIGLGRYGDPIDPDGDLKAIKELKRVVTVGGSLIFVAPIGRPKIQFNAHRIYSYEQIMDYFSDLKLEEFSLIKNDEGGIIKNATKEDADSETYGCGCFWFIKK